MSLLLITNPPTEFLNSSEWTSLVLRSNANMLGHGLSIPIFTLTNWDASTTQPLIAKDSIIEAGGSFYKADADTALVDDAGLTDGTVHIKLVPAGGGASVVPTLTNDVIPAWDANKAGWYDTLDKFLPFEMTKASAVFTVKKGYLDQNKTLSLTPGGTVIADGTVIAESITTNGAVNIGSDIGLVLTPGAIDLHPEGGEGTNVFETSYTKKNEAYSPGIGAITASFDIKSGDGVNAAFGRIYVNGSPVGTERTTLSTSYVNFTEQISGLVAGDLVQLYVKKAGGANISYNDFVMRVGAYGRFMKHIMYNDILIT